MLLQIPCHFLHDKKDNDRNGYDRYHFFSLWLVFSVVSNITYTYILNINSKYFFCSRTYIGADLVIYVDIDNCIATVIISLP